MVGRPADGGWARADGTAAPWGMVTTLAGSTSNLRHSRARAASDMTTTLSATAATASSTSRWCDVGSVRMVWAMTIEGIWRLAEDLEDLVAVHPAIHPVLVLHHGHVALVEQVHAATDGCGRAVRQLADDAGVPRDGAIGHPHHAHLGSVGRQATGEGRAERGQAAGGRGEGAQDPERPGEGARAVERRLRGACDAQESSFKVARSRRRTCTGRQSHDGRPAQARRLSQGDVRPGYRCRVRPRQRGRMGRAHVAPLELRSRGARAVTGRSEEPRARCRSRRRAFVVGMRTGTVPARQRGGFR